MQSAIGPGHNLRKKIVASIYFIFTERITSPEFEIKETQI